MKFLALDCSLQESTQQDKLLQIQKTIDNLV